MAQRTEKKLGARAHYSLGFFSFLRGGGTGVSPPVADTFFTTFLTTFFLGTSAGAVSVFWVVVSVGVEVVDSGFSDTEDSIWAAVVVFPFVLTPVWVRDTAPTGGVGTTGSSTKRRECCLSAGGEVGEDADPGEVTVGVRSSLAMMDCASAAASSSSLSGVGSGSAATGGLSCSLPAGLRRSAATQPIRSRRYSPVRLDVALVWRSH